jgi:hypothetical protein
MVQFNDAHTHAEVLARVNEGISSGVGEVSPLPHYSLNPQTRGAHLPLGRLSLRLVPEHPSRRSSRLPHRKAVAR